MSYPVIISIVDNTHIGDTDDPSELPDGMEMVALK